MSDLNKNKINTPNLTSLSKETIDGDIATLNFGPTHPQLMVFFKIL